MKPSGTATGEPCLAANSAPPPGGNPRESFSSTGCPAPVSTVHDDNYKVVSPRLGDRLRATGFVELADFNRDIPESRLATIRKSVTSRFPGCADLDAAETWTGFRPMTPDGPAIIGRGPRSNLFLNTGHGTFGWTLSAGSADLIAQIIDGEVPAVDLDAFRPGRFSE